MITKRKHLTALGATLIVVAIVATGCGSDTGGGSAAAEEELATTQELQYAPGQFPVSLDVHRFPAEEGIQALDQQVLETLVRISDDKAEPLLAESWDNPDPLTWIFHLREDVEFSDGKPFTADDVKASLDRMIALKGPLAALFAPFTEIRADDAHTFTIVTNQAIGTLLSSMSLVFIGQASAVNDDSYWLKPVGTGPFVVQNYVADDHVDLVRNEDYWGTPPKLDKLTFVNMPEIASKIAALETAEVQVITNVPSDQVSGVEGADGIEYVPSDSFGNYFIWFNEKREPFDDVRVRQAMWHAVDVESIVKDLYGDGASVARAPVAQAVFGAADLDQPTYDPKLSKKLLAEAGYPDGFTSSMMWTLEGGPNIKALAQAFISGWAEVGITIEPLERERAIWLQLFQAKDWDMDLQTSSTGTGDADFSLNRLYTCAPDRMGYCNKEVDSLLSQAQASFEQEEREQLYHEASKIVWDDAVGIFPADLKGNSAFRANVKGFVLPPNGRPDFSEVYLTK